MSAFGESPQKVRAVADLLDSQKGATTNAGTFLRQLADEIEWWTSEKLDLQAECREANASEAAAIKRAQKAEARIEEYAVEMDSAHAQLESQQRINDFDIRIALAEANENTRAAEAKIERLDRWLCAEYEKAYERFHRATAPGTSSAADGRAQALLDVMRRLGTQPSGEEDGPYNPNRATVPGGLSLPADARPDSYGLPEFGDL